MVRSATAIVAALLLISMAFILLATGGAPEPRTTATTPAGPMESGPEAGFLSYDSRAADASLPLDDGAGSIALRDAAAESVPLPSTPLVVEIRDVATGALCSRLPLEIRWRKPGRHWGSGLPAASVDGARAEIERAGIPADGELVIRGGSYTWPLVSDDLPVELVRRREEPLVYEVDTSTWQAVYLTDPDSRPIPTHPYATPDTVRLISDPRPGWLWVAMETCPDRRVSFSVDKLPWTEARLPAQRTETPVPVTVPFPWDLRIRIEGAVDPARYALHVLLPESMRRRPYGLAQYHLGPATLGEGTSGTFTDAHPRGEPRPIWRLGLNGDDEAVLCDFTEPGVLDIVLLDLGVPVARTSVELDGLGGERLVEFEVDGAGAVLAGRVVTADGSPIAGTRLLLDPGRGTDPDHTALLRPQDPDPAVQVETDADGEFRLPVNEDMDGGRLVLVHASGYGRRVYTIDELRKAGTVVLHPGRTVRMTVADRDGRPVSESTSWNTAGASRLEAVVELDHGVWRLASDAEWSQGVDRHGRDSTIGDIWIFRDLPEGELRFSMTRVGAAPRYRHDTRTPNLHWVGEFANDELMLGK